MNPDPTPSRPTIADQLREAIRASKKTVNAIAVEAGIPQPVLHRFAKGERDITLATAQKLADYFSFALVKQKRSTVSGEQNA